MKILNIGFENIVSLNKLVSVLNPEAAPVKRIVKNSKDSNTLLDATCGRKTQSVIIMDSGHVVISALKPETLEKRIEKEDNSVEEGN